MTNNSKRKIKVFIAHSKSVEDSVLDQMAITIKQQLEANNPTLEVIPVLGRDDFKAKAAGAGGWLPWMREVACGIDPLRGGLRFQLIIVPIDSSKLIGKGTFGILEQTSIPVKAWDGEKFLTVIEIDVLDPKNYQAGYRLKVSDS